MRRRAIVKSITSDIGLIIAIPPKRDARGAIGPGGKSENRQQEDEQYRRTKSE
jgi:hypothetical protein